MNYWELKPKDFPPGEPVLKMKRGSWYKKDNCGYCYDYDYARAGFYERDEAIRYCFDGDKNGVCDVLAVPIRLAMQGYTKQEIQEMIDNLKVFQQYAKDEPCE